MTIELTLQSKRYLDIRAALNFLIESDCHHSGHNVLSTKKSPQKISRLDSAKITSCE